MYFYCYTWGVFTDDTIPAWSRSVEELPWAFQTLEVLARGCLWCPGDCWVSITWIVCEPSVRKTFERRFGPEWGDRIPPTAPLDTCFDISAWNTTALRWDEESGLFDIASIAQDFESDRPVNWIPERRY